MMISSNAPSATLASSFLRQTNQPMITHQYQSVDDKATRIVIIPRGAANHDVPKYYQPDNVSILNNTAVTWINDDTAIHTATANESSFDTGIIPVGANATVIIKGEAGNIQYHCTIHPWMRGSLTILSSLTQYPFGNSSQLEQQYHQQTQGKIIAAGPALGIQHLIRRPQYCYQNL